MKNYRDGKTYTSEYGVKLYHTETGLPHPDYDKKNYAAKVEDAREIARVKEADGYARAVAPVWAVWLNRLFWLNLLLTLLNFIPAYPLDGGQILQGLVWARTDYRQGTVVACISGFVCAMAMFVVSIAVIEPLVIALCFFVLFACWVKWRQLTEGVGEFGYDTERGYSGMDDDEPPARPAKRVGPFKRWLQARAAKKLQREHEQRAKDDERMDQLLEKIARKEPISDEDRRFMQRVSERYRKPQ